LGAYGIDRETLGMSSSRISGFESRIIGEAEDGEEDWSAHETALRELMRAQMDPKDEGLHERDGVYLHEF